MTDQQIYILLEKIIDQFSSHFAPWVICVLVVMNVLSRREIKELIKTAAHWKELMLQEQELARKNYAAGMTWKEAFEKHAVARRAATRPPPKPRTPAPGHCHDERCEARKLKVHACHDLTCKQHVHEKRAR